MKGIMRSLYEAKKGESFDPAETAQLLRRCEAVPVSSAITQKSRLLFLKNRL